MTTTVLYRHWESPIILLAALFWIPGAGGDSFLSDDIGHLTAWGLPPFDQVWQWFYREDFGYYRPLTALLWKIEFALWGLQPFGYQLVNFVQHAACSLLVRELGRLVFPGENRIGFLSALLFLFLPGHIFGVLMVSALTGLLCALCYLAAIVFYLRGRAGNWSAQILAPLFFLLALLTKELALSLPILVGIWEAAVQRSERRLTLANWLRACWPYGLIILCYLLLRWTLFGQMPYSPLHANATPIRLLVNAAAYTAKCVVPWGLEDLKPFFRTYSVLLALSAGAGLMLTVGLLVRWRHSLASGHFFSLTWFAATLLPVVSLYSPWNTYLPSVGAALGLGALLDWTQRRKTARIRQCCLAVFLILSLIYSLNHQRHWKQARQLCAEVIDSIADIPRPGTIYLANLPAEWGDAPLFIADWALRGALHFQGRDRDVIALANIVKTQRNEQIETLRINEHRFSLRLLHPDEFFRLEEMEILSGQRPLDIGYEYSKSGFKIRVTGLSKQGQANMLEVDMGSAERLSRVYLWNGHQFAPLFTP